MCVYVRVCVCVCMRACVSVRVCYIHCTLYSNSDIEILYSLTATVLPEVAGAGMFSTAVNSRAVLFSCLSAHV